MIALTVAAPLSSRPPYRSKVLVRGDRKSKNDILLVKNYLRTWKPGKSGITTITLKHFCSLCACKIRLYKASNIRFCIVSSPESPDIKN